MLNENNTGHSQPSLPLEIRTATRAKHDALNRLITARIRLCLPPCAQNPRLYALGLSVCGSIYTAFESEWMRFLDRGKTDTPRMVDILQTVYIPNLLRTRNLENELVNLKPCSPNRTTLENASKVIGAHQNTIRTAIRAKPHVVLAYAWVMYMALFNGGRIIRAQLSGALPEFWECSTTPPNSEEGVHVTRSEHLQFWDFDDGRDGDNVKEELRKRADTAAAQLTVSERVDVVDEAVRIYERLHELVDWLDANANPGLECNLETRNQSTPQHSLWRSQAHSSILILFLRIPDVLWGTLVSVFCYFFAGRTQSRADLILGEKGHA